MSIFIESTSLIGAFLGPHSGRRVQRDGPKLFLFTASALGVYAVYDDNGTQARFPAGDSLGLLTAGNYLLGISRFGFHPLSAGGRIFPDDLGLTAATGPGSSGLLN